MRQCLTEAFCVATLAMGGRMGKLTTRRSVLRTSGGLLLAGLLLAFRPAPALGDDLLVMPYACSIRAGRPLLTPSQDHGHRIIGAREQRSFRACSPVNPTLCREWTIHRFDMDCQGLSLPWAAVAASARPERASYENGQLHLRMPPHWTLAADDPCAGAERWRYGRLQRYCADRRALSPPATVAMPPGFAPLLGIDAIFVTPSSAKAPNEVRAHSPQLPPPPSTATIARSEPSQGAVPKPTENEPQPARQSAAQGQPVAPTPSTLPPPIVPKIINRPGVVADPVPSVPPSAVGEAQSPAPEAPAVTVTPNTAKQSAVMAQAQPVAPTPSTLPPPIVPKIINRPGVVADPVPSVPPSAVGEAQSPAPEAPAVTVTPITPAASDHATARAGLAVLGAVLVALTALVLAILRARRRRLRPNRTVARSPKLAVRASRRVVRTDEVASTPAPIWNTVAAASPTWNEEVPRNRSDALRVLGMGVSADANLAAIKKIVDGLRQTWHPDLARDDSDREVREKRMKQINVAWDILAAKPARP
jgi:hypothetical protein